MIDYDLAELYEVETKALNQAVKRNIKRFPVDFMFQLSKDELKSLMSQIVTSNDKVLSRFVMRSRKRGGTQKLPFAFTEQGLAMLSGVLNSDKAIRVNILIMRAFVRMRHLAMEHKDIDEKLKSMERKYDRKFKDVNEALNYLLKKDHMQALQKQRVKIGFKK